MHRQPRRWAAVATVAATATLLAACSGGNGTATGDDAGPPQQGGKLVFALALEPACYDPQVSPQFPTYFTMRSVVDSLVAQQPDGSFGPWLAKDWQLSADGKQYTFTLRDDVTFSDGTKLDAAAVKRNLDRVADPATKSQYATSLLGPYQGTEVVDATHVTVSFTQPFAPFLQGLSTTYLGIQSPAALASAASCSPPVGSGPFVVASHTAQVDVLLRRRADYAWPPAFATNKGAAYLDEIDFRFVPEDATRVGSLSSDQVNAIDYVPAKETAALKTGYDVVPAVNPGATYQLFLNEAKAPFNDERAREAFRDALDLDGIVTATYLGQYQRAWSPLSPTTFGYDKSVEGSWKQDLDKANSLLDQLGYTAKDADGYRVKDGARLSVHLAFSSDRELRKQVLLLIQDQVKKVGIELVIDPPGGTYIPNIQNNRYDIGEFSYVRAEPDILRSLLDSANQPTTTVVRQNYSHLVNADVDAQLRQAAGALENATRTDLYAKVQRYAVAHAVTVPIYVQTTIYAWSKSLHGVTEDAAGYPIFYDAWLAQA